MKTSAILSIVLSSILCSACESSQPTAVNDQITDSVTQSVNVPQENQNQCTSGDLSDYPPHQDPLDQSSVNYVTYYGNGWSLAASNEWTTSPSRVPYSDLALTNPGRQMLFTLATERTTKSLSDYAADQLKSLQSIGTTGVSIQKTTTSGREYWMIVSPNSNYGNWQWITSEGNLVYVMSCGAARGTTPSQESCLDVILATTPEPAKL